MGETLELGRFSLRCSPLFSTVLYMTTTKPAHAVNIDQQHRSTSKGRRLNFVQARCVDCGWDGPLRTSRPEGVNAAIADADAHTEAERITAERIAERAFLGIDASGQDAPAPAGLVDL